MQRRVAQSFLKITFVRVSALWSFTTLRALAWQSLQVRWASLWASWDGNGPAASFFCETLQGKSLRASLGLLREHVPTSWREMSARLQSPVGAGTAGITLFGHVRLHLLALLYDLGSRAVQD